MMDGELDVTERSGDCATRMMMIEMTTMKADGAAIRNNIPT